MKSSCVREKACETFKGKNNCFAKYRALHSSFIQKRSNNFSIRTKLHFLEVGAVLLQLYDINKKAFTQRERWLQDWHLKFNLKRAQNLIKYLGWQNKRDSLQYSKYRTLTILIPSAVDASQPKNLEKQKKHISDHWWQ